MRGSPPFSDWTSVAAQLQRKRTPSRCPHRRSGFSPNWLRRGSFRDEATICMNRCTVNAEQGCIPCKASRESGTAAPLPHAATGSATLCAAGKHGSRPRGTTWAEEVFVRVSPACCAFAAISCRTARLDGWVTLRASRLALTAGDHPSTPGRAASRGRLDIHEPAATSDVARRAQEGPPYSKTAHAA